MKLSYLEQFAVLFLLNYDIIRPCSCTVTGFAWYLLC